MAKIYLRKPATAAIPNKGNTAEQMQAQRESVINEVTEVYQPIGRTKYLKTVATNNETGSKTEMVLGNYGGVVYTSSAEASDTNGTIIKTQALAPHIINRMKLSVSDADMFTNNPVLRYKTADSRTQNTEIDLQKYENEYQYRTKVLTIPIRFVFDSKFTALTWDLSGAADGATATVTLYVEKVIGQVTSI